MGVIYMSKIMNVASPKVGLLNIGAEETKGNAAALDAYEALSREVPEFAGNCEGGDLLAGSFDVVVCDGFSGNVCLKTIEGTSKTLFKYLKDAFLSSLKTKIGAVLLKSDLSALKAKVSPDTYGGTPLLGVKGACIVGHGSSNALAVKNGILAGARTVRSHVSEVIADTVALGAGSARDAVEAAAQGGDAR